MKKLVLLLMLSFPAFLASGQTSVLTQHNDNGRTGQNLNETVLTPSNVTASTFGKLFSLPVDGYVYAQPLYMQNVSIAGGTHNVVFVATEGDSVYAFDADNGALLWHVSVIDAAHGVTGETTVSTVELQAALGDPGCNDIHPQVGITSTPVIDSNTGTIYVEAKSTVNGTSFVHRLHMLSVANGAEKSPGPVVIKATAPGTSVTFDALHHLNRAGLLLANGNVYIGFGSHCDDAPWHGWILAYNESTLAQTIFISTPTTTSDGVSAGGIWMSGAGLAADSSGTIFTATGNGNFGATDVSDSILKLNGSTLTLSDYFTPFDQGNDEGNDLDVASGGVLLLPTQPGNNPRELIQGTKGGTIYLINRDQMTTNNQHFCNGCSSDPEIIQEILNAGNAAWLWATPAYFNDTVYFWGTNDVLKAYTLTNGLLGKSPSSSSTITFPFPGATPSISANGSTNGIVWAIDSSRSVTQAAILYAFDPSNVAKEYYNSTQMGSRDQAGNAVKFTVPTIANGKVYIGTQTEVDVYGLLGSGASGVATPTISPGAGTYAPPLTVTLTDSTAGATITYTTDGSNPVPGSNGTAVKSGATFQLTSSATVKAIGSASGLSNSGIATTAYTVQSSSGGGSSPNYGSGFTASGLTLNGNSIGPATINGTRLRLTDGGDYEATSAFFNTPVNIQSFTNNFSFQLTSAVADGFIFCIQGNGPTALGQNGAKLGYGLDKNGANGIGNSVAVKFDIFNNDGEGTDSTGLFTNGARPTIPAVDMTASGVKLTSGDVMNVLMTYDGTTLTWTVTDATTGASFTTSAAVNIPSLVGGNTAYVGFTASTEAAAAAVQDILTWTLVPGGSSSAVATPTISPGAGTYAPPLTVTLTDSTAGATITYTTDGSNPVPGSNGTAVKSGATFQLTSSATVKAIGSASGLSNSGIATTAYTVQSSSGGGSSPNYGSGFTASGLTLNGNSIGPATINGTRLRLTDGGDYEATSAFFNTPVNIQSFTNNFSFQLTSAVADGFIFCIQGNGPTALGQNGAKLGYGLDKNGANGIGNSVAVKFDIFNNDGEGTDSTGLFTNGARPTIPAVDMTASGVKLTSGDVMNVLMTYDGTTLTWTVTDATTGASFTTSAAVNIPSLVGGNTAYVGFTASTEAAAAAVQDILTWTLVPGGSSSAVATPTISPGAGTYAPPLTVTLTDSTAGATITYTTDGSNPVPGSNGTAVKSGATFQLTSSATVKAIGSASGLSNSGIATTAYTVQSSSGGGTPNYGSGFTASGLTLNGNSIGPATINGTRLRLTDGGDYEATSAFFNTPVNIQSFTNNFSFQLTSAVADGFIFCIQGNGPTALGQNGAKLGYGLDKNGANGIGNSVAVKFDIFNNDGEGTDSTGLFTNGARPTIPAVDMTASGVKLTSGDVMNVHMTYDGTTLTWTVTDATTGASFTTSAAVNIPSLVGGNTAYVGFTASTEVAAAAVQDILTWTYSN